MSFRIKTHYSEFSNLTGSAEDEMLAVNQRLTVFEDNKLFGVFFLKTWKDAFSDGTVFDFNSQDAISVLDSHQFAGDVYENVLARTLIQQIFDICFPTKLIGFELDSALEDKRVSGYIPMGTCRTALQYICFAIGAIADTSRRDYVWIYPPDEVVSRVIPREKIYRGGSVESTEYFSGVDVVSHTYTRGAEIKTVHNDILPSGTYTFNFSEPLHSLSITGGAILESSATFAIVEVPAEGIVTLSGMSYIAAKIPYSVRSEVVPGEMGRMKIYDGCTLIGRDMARETADRIFRHLQMRRKMDIEVRLDDLECGYIAKAYTYARPVVGMIQRLDIKLRGRRARLNILGNVQALNEWETGYKRLGLFSLGGDGELI